jgi:hypothetical protein
LWLLTDDNGFLWPREIFSGARERLDPIGVVVATSTPFKKTFFLVKIFEGLLLIVGSVAADSLDGAWRRATTINILFDLTLSLTNDDGHVAGCWTMEIDLSLLLDVELFTLFPATK